MNNIYVHGGGKFDINKFTPIKNRDFVKPTGGLWGSPINSSYGWLEWCEHNNFFLDKYKQDKFFFKLKEYARLLYINNAEMLKDLPKIDIDMFSNCFVVLDFEKLAQEYDAIEVKISSDRQLYWDLYGWDVDSILVMNPDVIEIVDEGCL